MSDDRVHETEELAPKTARPPSSLSADLARYQGGYTTGTQPSAFTERELRQGTQLFNHDLTAALRGE